MPSPSLVSTRFCGCFFFLPSILYENILMFFGETTSRFLPRSFSRRPASFPRFPSRGTAPEKHKDDDREKKDAYSAPKRRAREKNSSRIGSRGSLGDGAEGGKGTYHIRQQMFKIFHCFFFVIAPSFLRCLKNSICRKRFSASLRVA